MAKACRGPVRRQAEGEGLHWRRPGREGSGARGRPFFLWARDGLRHASAEPTVAERTRTAIKPPRLGLLPRCSWQRCMHMGEGPPPFTPWARAWGGRRLRPGALQARPPWVGRQRQPPEDAEGLFLLFPRSHGEGSSLGVGVGATEGWAALGSLSPAQQQRILGKPRLGLAGPWGQASACPSTQGGLQRPGRPSWRTWPQCGQAVHRRTQQGSPCT